jgi:hypothetical protein
MLQPAFMQQFPRWTGMRRIPTPPSLPWVVKDRPQNGHTSFGVIDRAPMAVAPNLTRPNLTRPNLTRPNLTRPNVVHGLKPMPATYFAMTANTKDGAGTMLPSCTVELYRADTDIGVDKKTSDANGAVEFRSATPDKFHYMRAYKTGSPDKAGTTLNTLVPGSAPSIYLRDPTAADSAGAGSGMSRGRVSNA